MSWPLYLACVALGTLQYSYPLRPDNPIWRMRKQTQKDQTCLVSHRHLYPLLMGDVVKEPAPQILEVETVWKVPGLRCIISMWSEGSGLPLDLVVKPEQMSQHLQARFLRMGHLPWP